MADWREGYGRSGRGTKRKVETNAGTGNKRNRGELSLPSLPPNGYPKEHPFNRDGYRYILAESDPHAPCRQEFDENQDMAGKPIPAFLCRVVTPEDVMLALHDRAPQLNVSDDRLAVSGSKFYCSVRATHSVKKGSWYFEVKLVDMPEGSATRIGWAQKNANLQAPLGFDKFGYSCRSRKGTRFHDSIGKHYSNGYKQGDVLGCLIELPEKPSFDCLPPTYKDKPLIKFKSHLYYEEKDNHAEDLKALSILEGSKISFFLNGKALGVAFTDIYAGDYYPAISIYKNATVRVNFGPKFSCKPPAASSNYRPMSERAREAAVDQAVAGMRFFTLKEGTLRIDNYCVSPWVGGAAVNKCAK